MAISNYLLSNNLMVSVEQFVKYPAASNEVLLTVIGHEGNLPFFVYNQPDENGFFTIHDPVLAWLEHYTILGNGLHTLKSMQKLARNTMDRIRIHHISRSGFLKGKGYQYILPCCCKAINASRKKEMPDFHIPLTSAYGIYQHSRFVDRSCQKKKISAPVFAQKYETNVQLVEAKPEESNELNPQTISPSNNLQAEFMLVPHSTALEYSPPLSSFSEELMVILKELPAKIKKNLTHDQLYGILVNEEKQSKRKPKKKQSESLVLIDSSKYEFFLSDDCSTSSQLFDQIIMRPYLSTWTSYNFHEIKTAEDFREKLLQYIQLFFQGKEIHALSFLLHFPKASSVRQWSHVDGTQSMWQGSVMCGDGFASTLEFSVLHPRVFDANTLQLAWPVQPSDCNVFEKMSVNQNCKHWLKTYGHLLNHDSETPLNSLPIQKMAAQKNWDSNFLAGTVLRMPGDTIHAGPPSCLSRCRGIFFSVPVTLMGPGMIPTHSGMNSHSLLCYLKSFGVT
jgi:hypothetical protein